MLQWQPHCGLIRKTIGRTTVRYEAIVQPGVPLGERLDHAHGRLQYWAVVEGPASRLDEVTAKALLEAKCGRDLRHEVA